MVGCGVCIFVALTVGILVVTSIKSLEPNELGLDYSANSLTIDTTQLYTAGVHYLGVGHSWISYPKSVLEIDMRSSSALIIGRTKDGLVIELQARLLYRLIASKERLAALYLMFKGEYATAYRSIARGTIRDVAAGYTAFEFWQQRDNITQVMKQELMVKLLDVHANMDDFLLSEFSLPSKFEEALTETEKFQQEKSQVAYEMETAVKEIETLVLASTVTVERMMIEANREANTTTLVYEAEVQRIQSTTDAEMASYQKLKGELDLTTEQLINVVWLNSLGGTNKTKKLFNVPRPVKLTL